MGRRITGEREYERAYRELERLVYKRTHGRRRGIVILLVILGAVWLRYALI